MVAACACRNCRQLVSVRRVGAGGIRSALRTRRIVDALTRWPSLSSSPWIRWYPQPVFSVASRSMSAAISALIGGRPVLWVPKTYATRRYSWMTPPTRSCRRTRK